MRLMCRVVLVLALSLFTTGCIVVGDDPFESSWGDRAPLRAGSIRCFHRGVSTVYKLTETKVGDGNYTYDLENAEGTYGSHNPTTFHKVDSNKWIMVTHFWVVTLHVIDITDGVASIYWLDPGNFSSLAAYHGLEIDPSLIPGIAGISGPRPSVQKFAIDLAKASRGAPIAKAVCKEEE